MSAPDLASVLGVVDAILEQRSLAVVRLKNRFRHDYDSHAVGGYRDVQLLCLLSVHGRSCYGEIQINLEDFLQIKKGERKKPGSQIHQKKHRQRR